MVMDKKHKPIYCWNSDKTYRILSVNKVLMQVISMLIYCVVVRIVYYPAGEGFFPRFLKLSNSYHWAVTMFLLNHPSDFCGRVSFPLRLLYWCTKIACYASLSHHCVRANSYQEGLL